MDPETLLQITRTWSNQARLEFAHRLWDDMIEAGWQPQPDDELAAELDRRLAAHEANPSDVMTSEEVWERLRRKR